MELIEVILSKENLNRVYKKIVTRIIQQAIAESISDIYEEIFSVRISEDSAEFK